MAVTLGYGALQGALKMNDAIDLLERAFAHEAAGRAHLSPKFVSNFEGGSMRMLFAADYEAGYCATKVYHTVKNAGARFLVSLYRLQDGELLALLDGRHITDMRTGAASGVIARKVAVPGPVTVGLIGSGHQARAQLGFPVEAVASAQAAARGHPVVAAASSARGSEPVLRGEWLDRCRLLCAVGNTRAQFAEVDVRCFQDARLVVVDTPHALEEAGELRQAIAAGALPESKRATLGQVVTGAVALPATGMVVFKSVGTALQDLALAARYYELLGTRAGVPTAADLASAKGS